MDTPKPDYDIVEHLYETFLLRASDSKSSLDTFLQAGEVLLAYRTSHPLEHEIAQRWFDHRERDRNRKRGRSRNSG